MNRATLFTLTPQVRKATLTSHIVFSVGWIGAIAVFLVLAVTGLTTLNNQLARSAYLAMELSTWYVILPFCLLSLFTGIIQALGTKWGLFSHYWIVVKLILTLLSTLLLVLHLQPISYLAGVASQASFSNVQYSEQVIDLITKAGAAILVLLAATTLSVYKPWNKIDYTSRSLAIHKNEQTGKRPLRVYVIIGLIIFVLFVIIKHLLSGGMAHH